MEAFTDVIQFAGVMLVLLTTGLGGWAGTIAIRRWEKRSEGASARELGAVHERLRSLEQAVDTIAVEMERVAEGQRFTSKLLAERAAVALPAGAKDERAGVAGRAEPRVSEPR